MPDRPSPEERLRAMGVSPALSAAYDVLDDAGQLTKARLQLCYAAEQQGQDPEAVARKLVTLARALTPTRPVP
jgi:hypothetical protein